MPAVEISVDTDLVRRLLSVQFAPVDAVVAALAAEIFDRGKRCDGIACILGKATPTPAMSISRKPIQ